MNALDTRQCCFEELVVLRCLSLLTVCMAMRAGRISKKDRHLSHLQRLLVRWSQRAIQSLCIGAVTGGAVTPRDHHLLMGTDRWEAICLNEAITR